MPENVLYINPEPFRRAAEHIRRVALKMRNRRYNRQGIDSAYAPVPFKNCVDI